MLLCIKFFLRSTILFFDFLKIEQFEAGRILQVKASCM